MDILHRIKGIFKHKIEVKPYTQNIYYQMFEEGIFQLEFPELTGNYEIDMEIIKKLERYVN
ncbi:MAG: hypothetical protein HN374_05470 [Cryomorphaceae bacterium]|jgi:hypothetical protein|nr:hypothetical protein [Cryomorphaceae bacterium]